MSEYRLKPGKVGKKIMDIYFRGHTDGFSYLKKIGAFKTE